LEYSLINLVAVDIEQPKEDTLLSERLWNRCRGDDVLSHPGGHVDSTVLHDGWYGRVSLPRSVRSTSRLVSGLLELFESDVSSFVFHPIDQQ
jgi:hypothetical protein